MCPATRATTKNTFAFSSMINDSHSFAPGVLTDMAGENGEMQIPSDGKLALIRPRKSSIENHINLMYNMSWLMFASEPLEVRVTAPYFPPSAPCPGALLSPGQFDIGRWYRAINLDYHIPVTTKRFEVAQDQELFYLEALTNKKVRFQRYELTDMLESYTRETTAAKFRFGTNLPLAKLYDLADRSSYRDRILGEIRRNLVLDQS